MTDQQRSRRPRGHVRCLVPDTLWPATALACRPDAAGRLATSEARPAGNARARPSRTRPVPGTGHVRRQLLYAWRRRVVPRRCLHPATDLRHRQKLLKKDGAEGEGERVREEGRERQPEQAEADCVDVVAIGIAVDEAAEQAQPVGGQDGHGRENDPHHLCE